jgi:hydrogenase maturation factor
MLYAVHGGVNSISFAGTFPLYFKCPLGLSCRFRVRDFDETLLSRFCMKVLYVHVLTAK